MDHNGPILRSSFPDSIETPPTDAKVAFFSETEKAAGSSTWSKLKVSLVIAKQRYSSKALEAANASPFGPDCHHITLLVFDSIAPDLPLPESTRWRSYIRAEDQ
jgi:hypothetical protein